MHMADALVSPAVGGAMWVAAAGAAAYSVKRLKLEAETRRFPEMAVMGAFVFAAQMVNFAIPGTGSSGHLGGGLLLAVLLGPAGGFLAMAAVLAIQALLFADGGLLAYGCNLINLGFFTCFVAYPLIYKPITRGKSSGSRVFTASLIAAVAGLQLGAFGVVLETVASGRTGLRIGEFALWMQPVHLVIGIVEGLVTAAILLFVRRNRPEMFAEPAVPGKNRMRAGTVLFIFLAAAAALALVVSAFASSDPDGLEWALDKLLGSQALASGGPADAFHDFLAAVRDRIALFPDYRLKEAQAASVSIRELAGAALVAAPIALLTAAAGFWGSKRGRRGKG